MRPIPLAFRVFALVVAAAITSLVVQSLPVVPWVQWPQLLLVFLMIVTVSLIRGSSPRGTSFTPTTVLTYLCIYVFSPATAALVVGTSRFVGFALARGWVPWRAIFNGSQAGLSVALGAYVFSALGASLRGTLGPADYLAAVVAPIANHVANNFFVGFASSQTRGRPLVSTWLAATKELFWPNLLSIPTAFVLAILYVRVHYSVTLAYLVLLPFQWMALRLYVKRRELYAQIVDGLVAAVDANFPTGRGHARRVADIALAIGREMRLGESALESLQLVALLHDIGMIGKDDLLNGPLLAEEDAVGVRDHTRIGAELARELPGRDLADAILHHHERYDGTGYPDGLKGDKIPVLARIVALADGMDNLRLRSVAEGAPGSVEAMLEYAREEKGRSFDPDVVEAFASAVESGQIPPEWVSAGAASLTRPRQSEGASAV
jgi:HD-GYP domain-containing protein (c-di-GMP phosphodiesterase class II)